MGPPGAKKNPTYKEVSIYLGHSTPLTFVLCPCLLCLGQVCTGETEQVEVYFFEFEGNNKVDDEKTYENLVKHFFMFHDPTLVNRQEQDIGTQYASVIYVFDDKQVRSDLTVPFYTIRKSFLSSVSGALFFLVSFPCLLPWIA
jgi:hypothetical protein